MATSPQPPPEDVFAHIRDVEITGALLRSDRLAEVRRGYAPIRKIVVQRPNSERVRASTLAELITGKNSIALRLLLLVYALEPILQDARWPPAIWAKLIGGSGGPVSVPQVRRAFALLERMNLVATGVEGSALMARPLDEKRNGDPYHRPTAKGADVGPGYFIIPHDFWDSGLADRLSGPGLAMFLISLQETDTADTFQVAYSQMDTFYGVSERTAERGFLQLSREGILLTKSQKRPDRKMRTASGQITVYHRALTAPYSKKARDLLQLRTKARVKALEEKSGLAAATGATDTAGGSAKSPATGKTRTKLKKLPKKTPAPEATNL